MTFNYNDKKFRPIITSDNGEISIDTIFHYQQENDILTCQYKGGKVIAGQLIGIVDADGVIQMCYHQVNNEGQLMTGKCVSTPEVLGNGKIRLHENWQWTSGDFSIGESVIEEI